MKKIFKKITCKIKGNDISIRIYMSFAFVLVLTSLLTGAIFIKIYEKNYIRSYTSLLTKQGKTIARRVAKFDNRKRESQFQKYSVYIDEIERAEKTDIWIVSNKKAAAPLSDDYTNSEISEDTITKEMNYVLDCAYDGNIASNTAYDKVYGMVILYVAVPVRNISTNEVSGAVLLVSMVDRQTMGIKEGKSIISMSVLLSAFISLIVAVILSRYLSRPLEKIGKEIGNIALGDYSGINVKHPESQIGRLETNLDDLSSRLESAKVERESQEQLRMDFFANVSHELRTPITVMRGYAETLNDGVVSEENMVREIYQKMLTECRGMERLVGDLFILSKMQNPDFRIEKEPVSIRQVFGDVIRSAREIGKEKNIAITLKVMADEEDPCLMLGDYERLRQMFMIIIDNAVKFSNQDGEIIVCIEKNDKIEVSIEDFGVGISKEALPYIFEKFYKSKLKQNQKGTGLGLMIAKQIALRHGSEIKVQSEVGKGTKFSFSFEECTAMEDYE
ncbi:HAMP domain-containing histidine kinase [Eubacterium sp. MSJ-13]|uniref:sensor histidine kinase n=1 Tax=Eubacterium sp. MSJ-13 TaxID=2841513 RepID=UPI001C10B952|nr:ATP-binding protein [Eubacterium sp. MSJ-13]MBU5478585.1 HAMP domain-containing histidine kinase [Eubacterium sp. MSJ-13]